MDFDHFTKIDLQEILIYGGNDNDKKYWNGENTELVSDEEQLADKEFVAYSKKLLRVLKRIEKAMDKDIETAKNLLAELIEDTESDIKN